MFKRIISFAVQNGFLVIIAVLVMAVYGVYSATKLPVDAVPDITNNQVQIVTTSPTLAAPEVEQLITFPIEVSVKNIPDVEEVRSISRYGLSVVTVVFKESVEGMLARQYVSEALAQIADDIPQHLGSPSLMPITTGLGEIYQYVLVADSGYSYSAMQLRTIQDWIVKRQLAGTEGIIEVSSFGGFLKEYEVAADPHRLASYNLTFNDVLNALEQNNDNGGGSYIESGSNAYYIRALGRVESLEDIRKIPLAGTANSIVRIEDVATVDYGAAKRYGAMTMDGQGEVVGGITLMLKGSNPTEALQNVKQRMEIIQGLLPEGIRIYPYLDRAELVAKTTHTVQTNLLEGGLIVIVVLLLLLGNFRAGLIVASVIPLSLLFALILMRWFGVSANLMSLGAVDFGIVVDGAVVIIEAVLFTLHTKYAQQRLTRNELKDVVVDASSAIYRSAAFGVLIILVVFLPIVSLQGVEGKMFRPMALTMGFAILGSLLLSTTYVPVMASLFLRRKQQAKATWADRFMQVLKRIYLPILQTSLSRPWIIVLLAGLLFTFSVFTLTRLGAEFIPTLEEGDIAMQQSIKPGSSLQESIRTATQAEQLLLAHFPEVEHVVSKIGTAEVPTDPMAIEDADVMIILKDKEDWVTAQTRVGLMDSMKKVLEPITWASYEFTQPIQLRFNELMTGSKADISVKLFGENLAMLKAKADEIAEVLRPIEGVGDVKVDQTEGLKQLTIRYNREQMGLYGVDVERLNQTIKTAYAGTKTGTVYENERSFDVVVRLDSNVRKSMALEALFVRTSTGQLMPLSQFAQVVEEEAPMLIPREDARRFIGIGINVRDRDVAGLVAEVEEVIAQSVDLPPGYEIVYGGQFENLQHAKQRLLLVVPLALVLILIILYIATKRWSDTLIIFVSVPLSAIGGILALALRGMPFSISSSIGFIALFGVSVLNGLVLINAINQLKANPVNSLKELLTEGCVMRLRPVLMTALVAAFGFLPMALSTGNGAEVQRPLATVVIGGLISSTLLTLLVLPSLYFLWNHRKWAVAAVFLLFSSMGLQAQTKTIGFSQLLDSAKMHSIPALKTQADIETLEADKRSIGLLPKTEVDYTGGDINYNGFDHYIEVNQELSNLFTLGAEKKVLQARQDKLANSTALVQNQLEQNLYMQFEQYNMLVAKQRVVDSLLHIYRQVGKQANLQYQVGSLSIVDKVLVQNEVASLQADSLLVHQEKTSTAYEILALAGLDSNYQLTPEPFHLQKKVLVNNSMQEVVLAGFDLDIQQVEKTQDLQQKKAALPGFSLGYFYQTLEKQRGFQGLNAGLQIPLDFRLLRAEKAKAESRQNYLEQAKKIRTKQLEARESSLWNKLFVLAQTVEEYKVQWLETQKAQTALLQQLTTGQISYLTFAQIQDRFLNYRLQYLETVLNYNLTRIELSFL